MFADFDWDPYVLGPLLLACVMAGLVRGFSGFGAGLIFMPVASALVDPRLAAVVFLVVDSILTLPMIPPAMRTAHWPTVLPAALAALCLVPVGAFVLVSADVTLLRWMISGLILVMLALLLSGWRYRGTPVWPASVGVGSMAGFLSGVSQVPGPPVVTYWMAGPLPARIIRANLISFFFITTLASVVSYFVGGLFTANSLELIVVLAPAYAISIWLGANGFRFASETGFRRLAYAVIALSAITSMPALDAVLRG